MERNINIESYKEELKQRLKDTTTKEGKIKTIKEELNELLSVFRQDEATDSLLLEKTNEQKLDIILSDKTLSRFVTGDWLITIADEVPQKADHIFQNVSFEERILDNIEERIDNISPFIIDNFSLYKRILKHILSIKPEQTEKERVIGSELGRIFGGNGYWWEARRVLEANDESDALNIINRSKLDIILSDEELATLVTGPWLITIALHTPDKASDIFENPSFYDRMLALKGRPHICIKLREVIKAHEKIAMKFILQRSFYGFFKLTKLMTWITEQPLKEKSLYQIATRQGSTPEEKNQDLKIAIEILSDKELINIIGHVKNQDPVETLRTISQNHLDPQYIANNFVFPPGLTPSELFGAYAAKLLKELKNQEYIEDNAKNIKFAIKLLSEKNPRLNIIEHARHPLDRLYIIAQNHLDPQYIARNFVFPSELTPPELFEKYATKLLEELKTQEALQLKRKREEADTLATSSRPRRP